MVERPNKPAETPPGGPGSPGVGRATPTRKRPRCASASRTSATWSRTRHGRRPQMQELIDKIERRTARCGVIGLGYVGLPLALEFAKAGFHVTGIDLDERKVEAIAQGRSYIVDVRDEEIAEPVRAGRFVPTTDFSVIRDLDTINICVPTPLRKTKDPDLTYVVSAVNEIKRYLRRGPARHPREHDVSRHHRRGGAPGARRPRASRSATDFALAFSPERIDPGNAQLQHAQHPEGRRRRDPDVHPGGEAALRGVGRHRRAGVVHRGRRDGEAAREHLPQRQHRAGQRDRAHVQRPQDQRLGGHRRRQDQAVRLHGVLPRARARAGTASRSTPSTCRGRRR